MRQLTSIQKEFLFDQFFRNDLYPGWRHIAGKLLETGECVVAGNISIYLGGIGNFIKTQATENFIGCLLYTFDLECFLSSAWYKQIYDQYIKQLEEKKFAIQKEFDEISNLKL